MPPGLEMPSDLEMSQLEAGERHDQAALLDALHCLDDFDFDGLEVGQASSEEPSSSPPDKRAGGGSEGPPPPVGEPPPQSSQPGVSAESPAEERRRQGSEAPSRQQSPQPAQETRESQEGPPRLSAPEEQQRPRQASPAGSVAVVSETLETGSVKSETDRAFVNMEYREGTANITDFSPEWAYPEVSPKEGVRSELTTIQNNRSSSWEPARGYFRLPSSSTSV